VLLHREADDVWRIDFQLGWDADPEVEKQPERVIPRIRAMLEFAMRPQASASPTPPPGGAQPGQGDPARVGTGPQAEVSAPAFELEWVSVYTFQCRRMQRFRHGRVLFAGDAAHQVSPFGARGANSGLQDADNLAWKLKLVIDGHAPDRLLDSYSDERVAAADENLANSTRSTDFITPKSQVSRDLRQAVLGLARDHAFARALVNSGRLSVPAHLGDSWLNTPDTDRFEGWMAPGAPMADAPVRHRGRDGWLLEHAGHRFVLLAFVGPGGEAAPPADAAARLLDAAVPVAVVPVVMHSDAVLEDALVDRDGLAAQRYDARPGTCVLLRPDQHVAARWRRFDLAAVQAAVARATGHVVAGASPAPQTGTAAGLGPTLITHPHLGLPGERARHAYLPGDAFYEALIEAHRGLTDEASREVNARLVLLLANHVGDLRVLHQALEAARAGVAPSTETPR
jgi:3-(3-hydroxy-phenyl)propionate hydroxylase